MVVAEIVSQDPESADPLPDVALLDAKITEAIAAIENATSAAQERKARERKEDFMRLKRVETIYVGLVNVMSPVTHLR